MITLSPILVREAAKGLTMDLKRQFKAVSSNPERVLVLSGYNHEEALTLAAQYLRHKMSELLNRQGEIGKIPVWATPLLAHDMTENYRSAQEILVDSPFIILEEYESKTNFITKPDSFILDKLQYAFRLLTTALDFRAQHNRTTVWWVPTVKNYTITGVELYPFYLKNTSIPPLVWRYD
jgi:hypothetical protein